tara:strand:- start:421 stop:951 length:531 start_codon:yes stop_codon:yes gene_type:complete
MDEDYLSNSHPDRFLSGEREAHSTSDSELQSMYDWSMPIELGYTVRYVKESLSLRRKAELNGKQKGKSGGRDESGNVSANPLQCCMCQVRTDDDISAAAKRLATRARERNQAKSHNNDLLMSPEKPSTVFNAGRLMQRWGVMLGWESNECNVLNSSKFRTFSPEEVSGVRIHYCGM